MRKKVHWNMRRKTGGGSRTKCIYCGKTVTGHKNKMWHGKCRKQNK